MKIFVTGASGYMGGHLLKRLESEDNQVHALVRNPETNKHLSSGQTQLFKGDILDVESIKNAMQGCRQVYHLAACTSMWEKNPEIYYDINVMGTKNVLNSALELGIDKIVVSSTAGVYGPSLGGTTDEDTPRRIDYFNEYESSKAISESFIKSYIIKHNMNIVIVNPTRVYGPFLYGDSSSVTLMIEKYCKGTWRFIPGNGNKIGNYVFIDDVIEGHIQAMAIGKCDGNYLLSGINCSYNELFAVIRAASGKRYKLFHTPMKLQLLIGWLQMLRTSLTGQKPLIVPKWIRRTDYDWRVSTKKLNEELMVKTTSLEIGIDKTVKWVAAKKGTHGIR